MLGNGLLGKAIQLTSPGVPFNFCVETLGVELIKPGAKAREFLRRELGDGLLDFIELTHKYIIARKGIRKTGPEVHSRCAEYGFRARPLPRCALRRAPE